MDLGAYLIDNPGILLLIVIAILIVGMALVPNHNDNWRS